MTPHEHAVGYAAEIHRLTASVDTKSYNNLFETLIDCYSYGQPVYVAGNGGSASVANHFVCDHVKGIGEVSEMSPNVVSLCSNIELMTALANDTSYDRVFSKQIEYHSAAGNDIGLVIVMSVSGSSPNVVNALKTARDYGHTTCALLGKDGGDVLKHDLADIVLHFSSTNYGIVEDCFAVTMHALADRIKTRFPLKCEK